MVTASDTTMMDMASEEDILFFALFSSSQKCGQNRRSLFLVLTIFAAKLCTFYDL